jgi:hypothetical protein
MAHNNRNFILAYTLLVGLPILGLIGILKSGRKLTAPISVDVVWNLQLDASRLASLPCGKTLADAPETALAISQSGKNFVLNLNNGPKSVSSGVLEGTAIKALIVPAPAWSSEVGCSGRELSLVATVDPRSEPRSLNGSFSISDCPACGSVDFHATRQAPPARRGSH